MNYTVVSGTNRPGSNSLIVSKYYQSRLNEKGLDAQLIDLQSLPKDFIFSHMYGEKNPEFDRIQSVVSNTDKFLFIIPEYNGGFPGVLKAFIDACKFPESFAEKKCALTGLSDGKFGNLRGISHFSGIANYIKMDVYHNKMYLPAIGKDINDDGMINDEHHVSLIDKQIEGFINF